MSSGDVAGSVIGSDRLETSKLRSTRLRFFSSPSIEEGFFVVWTGCSVAEEVLLACYLISTVKKGGKLLSYLHEAWEEH